MLKYHWICYNSIAYYLFKYKLFKKKKKWLKTIKIHIVLSYISQTDDNALLITFCYTTSLSAYLTVQGLFERDSGRSLWDSSFLALLVYKDENKRHGLWFSLLLLF